MNNADREIFDSFSEAEKKQILAQPDRSARRNKMLEIWKKQQTQGAAIQDQTLQMHGSGASGGW